MIKVVPIETIDLSIIEATKKWLEFRPDKIDDIETKLNIELTLLYINKFYNLIKEVIGKEPDIEEKYFYAGTMSIDQYDEYKRCLEHIILVNIPKMALYKLTEEERKNCEDLMLSCNQENFEEIMNKIQSMENFGMKSFSEYLLLHDIHSNYKYSANVLRRNLPKKHPKLSFSSSIPDGWRGLL